MVIGSKYIHKKRFFYFFKHFFQLWRRWISSGGRSQGMKVFWGMVSYKKSYFFNFNYSYSVWNTVGIIQLILKNLKMNFSTGLVFYPIIGLFSINLLEQFHEITSFIKHNTTCKNNYIRGDSVVLKNANIGLVLFGIQSQFSKKMKFARSAGCYTKIIKKSLGKIYIQLPSYSIYIIPETTAGTVGLSSKKILWKLTKAGQSWYLLWIPKVRGIAMNPVDHPHGGWTNKGCHPVTPTGFLTKGVKTRKPNIWSKNKIYSARMKKI